MALSAGRFYRWGLSLGARTAREATDGWSEWPLSAGFDLTPLKPRRALVKRGNGIFAKGVHGPMPSITYDGRSFMLDGRRIWLAGGTIAYARVPRASWADRIHAAKLAGLNTIDTPVYWNRHEPRPGKFDFKGENDLRHFIQLIGQAGMYCTLRLGPYINDDCDMGGLPAWLVEHQNLKLRTTSGPFLEACSRYITAVADQIRDLQMTAPGVGGPILLIQNENSWTCGDDTLAESYLGELSRYINEAGLDVPCVNNNNLWQAVEGEIDCWAGADEPLSTMRQLSNVRATQPRLVIDFPTGSQPRWGEEPHAPLAPWMLQRRLAEVLAGGGQFNLRPFHGGHTLGFSGGRLDDGMDSFAATTADHGAPLTETGAPGATFGMVRRISTFATRFARVLSHLDPMYQPVSIDPGFHNPANGESRGKTKAAKPANPGHAVVHATGSQGGVVFVFADQPGRGGTHLLLPDGTTLPVDTGAQGVSWCLFDTNITGRSRLDYTNLNAFANIGKVFVCYGPAGSRGVVSINGSPMEFVIPGGRTPHIVEHENLFIAACNEEQIDSTYVTENAVYFNVAGVTDDGHAIPLAGAKALKLSGDGEQTSKSSDMAKLPAASASDKVSISAWTSAGMEDHVSGESPRFATINGPAEIANLGSPSGYGWYRITLKNGSPAKTHAIAPGSGDRLHMFLDGADLGVLGHGPGAAREITLPLKKATQQLVVLAENLGRFAAGPNMGEGKGLRGHLFEFEPIKPGKPKLVNGQPLEVLKFRKPLWEVRPGDSTEPDRVTWTITHKKKTPIAVCLKSFPGRGLLVINDKPAAYLDRSGPETVTIEADQFAKGHATIQIAMLADADGSELDMTQVAEALSESVTFVTLGNNLTAKADWAFAKWEPPSATSFSASKGKSDGPRWWRCKFKPSGLHAPLYIELAGMTKGQLYVNGRHVGRYWVATGAGKHVGPQTRYLIPHAWLKSGEENELVLFDEHGGNPAKVRLVFDTEAHVIHAKVATAAAH